MKQIFVKSCVTAAIVIFLSGCTATQNANTKPLDQLMTDSNKALTEGKTDKAMETLDTAAKENPTSALPWVKQAQIYFDQGNYPASIQAADEAMKRDAENKDAKALAVVASLRVAVQAVSDMNKDSNLRGSKRSEAERLATALRETLNQDVLVPLDAKAKPGATSQSASSKHTTTTRHKASAAEKPAATATQATPKPAADTSGSSGSANPFGALR